jgi:hypothetical protein
LDVIRQLKQSNNIPIQQAQMRVQLTVPGKEEKKTTRISSPKNNVFFSSERREEIQRKNE